VRWRHGTGPPATSTELCHEPFTAERVGNQSRSGADCFFPTRIEHAEVESCDIRLSGE